MIWDCRDRGAQLLIEPRDHDIDGSGAPGPHHDAPAKSTAAQPPLELCSCVPGGSQKWLGWRSSPEIVGWRELVIARGQWAA